LKRIKSIKHFDWEIQYFEHDSTSTKTSMKFSVFIPQGNSIPDSALIWLSGLTCNEENFISKSGFGSHLAATKTMIICPDTSPRWLDLSWEHESYDFGSGAWFYLNATTSNYALNYNMYDYINTEIYTLLVKYFKVPESKISIFGHSMWGHGALTIGLKNLEKYQSISAFSPIVNPVKAPWGKKAFTWYLWEDEWTWKNYDAVELINAWKKHKNPILIDQGSADDFLEQELLTENIVEATHNSDQILELHYREWYDHSYYFISTFLWTHISFHLQYLK